MARFQFDTDPESQPLERTTQRAQTLVRGSGFLLLIVGLWIALAVIIEAWSLYRNPQQIVRMADAIEQGSNLDHSLAKANQGLAAGAPDERDTDAAAVPSSVAADAAVKGPSFRLSYFAAWLIAILLLMLIGRLALGAVKTGGELVLYDLHIKRFVRELMREASSNSRS